MEPVKLLPYKFDKQELARAGTKTSMKVLPIRLALIAFMFVECAALFAPRFGAFSYIVLAVMLLFVGIYPLTYPAMLQGLKRANLQAGYLERGGQFDDTGMESSTGDGVRSVSPWSAMTGARELKDYFALEVGGLPRMIPKRAFATPEDLIAFRSMLKRHNLLKP
jgi:hypothetical protein